MDTLLGRSVAPPQRYAPELLRRVERHCQEDGGASSAPYGVDVWHAYEASCLTDAGLPVVCVLKMAYPSASRWIVESKSLKLYLNSLNNERMGAEPAQARAQLVERARGDLQRLLEVEVQCHAHTAYTGECDFSGFGSVDGDPFDWEGESALGALRFELHEGVREMACCSALLRSRCPVTGQPDWGNLYVRLRGLRLPRAGELLRYVVGLREERHFHEAICEATYGYLWSQLQPEALMVACLYTRRGGIDICPVRSSELAWLPAHLVAADRLTAPAWRQ